MELSRNNYQRNSTWNVPYTFSGKEKDVETGYGYFGARYYDSGLSIWLSVDPMSDKYPSMSPYNYCANNPVILVDPDGREIGDYFDQNGTHIGSDGDQNNNVSTDPSTADITLTTSRFVMTAIAGVYTRTINNGRMCEEGAMVLAQGSNANRIKDLPRGKCGDEDNFLHFSLNVVIGRTIPAFRSKNVFNELKYTFQSSQIGAQFYDSQGKSILKMNIEAVEKIAREHPAPVE